MKVPISWLKEFVTVDVPVDELAERLTFAGLEVGEVIEVGNEWDPALVLVGAVVEVKPHPDADRLTVATVDCGGGRTETVVTGAPNIRPGLSGVKVPLALAGARLRDPYGPEGKTLVLKAAKLRGVPSAGMICSEKELGISDEHEGIMLLPDDAPLGAPLRDYLGDTVLSLDLTPNLSYCLSLRGVAREVSALGAGALIARPLEAVEEGGPAGDLIELEIADPALCSRYCAAVVTNVTVGPSPFLMRHRLKLAGIRAINNIVDVTNYVMWETGQPLHAFDYDRLRPAPGGGTPKIQVRTATAGEEIRTLDGVDRVCTDETLLICDGAGPVAVAGVMGGEESEVSERTTRVLIESAHFDNVSVRRTAAALRLPSEASMRFGRGVSAAGSLDAARRAAALMRLHGGGTVARDTADLYPCPQPERVLGISPAAVERSLGTAVPAERMREIFVSLGFQAADADDGALEVRVPPYRLDVAIPADLVEEVARITGYDRIPAAPMSGEFPPPRPQPALEAEDRVRDVLAACGLTEAITYSLTDPALSVSLGLEDDAAPFLALANPMSADRTHLRRHLIPSLIETLKTNLRFTDRVAVFEAARVYLAREGEPLPAEPRRLGLLLCGPSRERWWGEGTAPGYDFFHLKGILETLLRTTGAAPVRFAPVDEAPFQRGRAAEILRDGRRVGTIGELDPARREALDLPPRRVALAECDLHALLGDLETIRYRRLSRFPALTQDLALVCPEEMEAAGVEAALRDAAGGLLVDLRLFDVYRGDQVPPGKKSLAYTLLFRAPDRTLTEEEINRLRGRIVRTLEKKLGVTLRG